MFAFKTNLHGIIDTNNKSHVPRVEYCSRQGQTTQVGGCQQLEDFQAILRKK
jgi:hypothetical protein